VSTAGPQAVVLVVEDDASVRRVLGTGLPLYGFRVLEATTAAEALRDAGQYVPDLVVLDLGLPDKDGLDVIRGLRRWFARPIVVLSARGQEGQKVAALEAGADDYVTKPFGFLELVARLKAALRRSERPPGEVPGNVFETGPLRVDLAARRVWMDDEEVRLTPTEWNILAALVRNAGRVVTHDALAREVWGPASPDVSAAARVHLTHVRRKLAGDPKAPPLIETLPGIGYRLRAD
jgi:two-component system KDP operon response regulator KdpE